MVDSYSWTSQEDHLLEQLVNTNDQVKWKVVAGAINKFAQGRKKKTARNCKDRWNKNYHSTLQSVSNDFNLFEEYVFYQAHSSLGNKWSHLTRYLPHKSDNCLKNHFYSNLRKVLRKVPRDRSNFADFTEKVKALYTISYILANMTVTITKDKKECFVFKSDNLYIGRLIRRNKINSRHLKDYHKKLCVCIVNDKFVRERVFGGAIDESPENVSRVISALIQYEAIKKSLEEGLKSSNFNKKFEILRFLQENINKLEVLKHLYSEHTLTEDNRRFIKMMFDFINTFNNVNGLCVFPYATANDSGSQRTVNMNAVVYEEIIKSHWIIQQLFLFNKRLSEVITSAINQFIA